MIDALSSKRRVRSMNEALTPNSPIPMSTTHPSLQKVKPANTRIANRADGLIEHSVTTVLEPPLYSVVDNGHDMHGCEREMSVHNDNDLAFTDDQIATPQNLSVSLDEAEHQGNDGSEGLNWCGDGGAGVDARETPQSTLMFFDKFSPHVDGFGSGGDSFGGDEDEDEDVGGDTQDDELPRPQYSDEPFPLSAIDLSPSLDNTHSSSWESILPHESEGSSHGHGSGDGNSDMSAIRGRCDGITVTGRWVHGRLGQVAAPHRGRGGGRESRGGRSGDRGAKNCNDTRQDQSLSLSLSLSLDALNGLDGLDGHGLDGLDGLDGLHPLTITTAEGVGEGVEMKLREQGGGRELLLGGSAWDGVDDSSVDDSFALIQKYYDAAVSDGH